MLSLIKIRIKYVIRHPCLLFWTYIFLPILTLIGAIYVIKEKEKEILRSFDPILFSEKQIFFKEKEIEYLNIRQKLNFTGFLVQKLEYCEGIYFVLKECNICKYQCPICTDKELNFNNYTKNIIKINKKEGKYNVYLASRYINYDYYYYEDYYYDEGYYYRYYYDIDFFDYYDLDQEIIIDPYNINGYYNYEYEYNYYYNYYHDNKYKTLPRKLDIFFELQSLMARILIKLEGKEVKDNFDMY